MEIKCTPGPWKVGLGYEQEEVGFYIQDSKGRIILSEDVLPLKADMQLIEAAPELLKALEHLVHNLKASGKRIDLGLAMDFAQDAIAKAKAVQS